MSTRTSRVVWDLIARDNASRTFARVSGAANGLSRTGAGVGAALRRSFAAGSVAAAGLGVSVLKMAGDFEKNMNRVEALSGATGSQLEKLRNQAKELGRSTQYGAAQSADAMAQLATAGLNVNQIYGAMPSVLSLASSEQLDLTRAAEITTSVLTGYGMSVKEIPHAVDAMVKASVKANTSVDDLGEAFKYSGPIAHQAGIKFEEAAAATALMGNAGIKASMAGTALRGAVTRLLSPTDKIKKTLDNLGVSVTTSGGKLRPLTDIVGQLAKKGATTGDIMTIFGQRAGPGMAALIQQGSDKLAGLTKELENSGGTAEKISKVQMKGWRGEITRLKNAWEGLMIEIGDSGVLTGATKVLSGITGGVRDFAGWVNTSGVPAAKHFGGALADMVPVGALKKRLGAAKTAVGDFFSGLSGKGTKNVATPRVDKAPMVLPQSQATQIGSQIRDAISGGVSNIDWSTLGSGLGKGLSTAFGWIGKHAADLTKKVGSVIASIDWVNVGKSVGGQAIPFAIGFIVNLFEPLFHLDFWKKHWLDTILAVLSIIPIGKAAGVLEKLFTKIPILKAFSPLLKGIEGLGSFVEKGFMRFVVKPIGKFGSSVLKGISDGFVHVFPATKGKLGEIIGKLALNILGYTARFVAAGDRMIGGFGRGILKAGAQTGKWIGQVIGWALKPFAKIGGWLIGKGQAFLGGLKTGVVNGAKGLGGWVWRTAGRPTVDAFKGVGGWLLSKGSSFVGGLKTGVVNGAKGLGGWVWRTAGRPAVNAFKDTGSWLKSKGAAFVSGMKNGIVGAVKGIGSWIKKYLVDPVVNAVKHFFGIRSPSRVFMGIGGHLVAGLMKGMAKTSGKSIATKVFGSLPKALAAIVKKGLVSVSSLPSKALKALGGLGGDILSFLGLGGGSGSGSSKNQQIGQLLAATRGWSGPQWAALKNLWNGESGWNERALNASSGAYGIPQSLPASKMASAGADWKTNASTQIKWGLSYIASRYGNPVNAYSAWLSRSPHWYAKGTRGAARGLAWVGEKGAELVNFGGGEDVLNHEDSIAFAKTHGIRLPGYASGTVANAQAKVNQAKKELEQAQERHYGIQAAKTRLKAAQQELANAKRRTKISVENAINNGFKKTLTTGTAAAIGSAIKSMIDKLQNAGVSKKFADSVLKAGEKLQSLATKKASVAATIKQANEYAADQSSSIKDFLSISGTSATTVGGLISQMQSGQQTVSGFANLTKSLKSRGASKELLEQLAEAGPGSQLATILGDKSVTTGDIGKLNSLVKSGNKLADNFGKSMADTMYDSGKHAGEGFLAGLKAQEKDLQKAMESLADGLIKSIKKKLKIKSPSGVFRDQIGKQLALGMARGMDDHRPHVEAAARRLADSAYGGAKATSSDAAFNQLAQMLGSDGFAAAFDVQVKYNDAALRDLIDVQVTPKIKASEDRQAYRARVGRRG
ncbi:phage tail tape measure protein [Streptomyces cylindrosporus]|uniref:Phage tail tape measure protein n=1 Tax=Streptomyces cylindrosporus TaxID=2927583 RepID=A0ABS9YNW1_9ACTN|nr:phage tail tape measure protein [Streptomyces cylindrosporus]MCI3277531.1 phage tail tape measure protein [Streptomyces cylindrosporus]